MASNADAISRLASGFVRDREAGGYQWQSRGENIPAGSRQPQPDECSASQPAPRVYARHAVSDGASALDGKGRLVARPPRSNGVRRDLGVVRGGMALGATAGRQRSVKCTGCAWSEGCRFKDRHPFWQRWCRLEWETTPLINWRMAAVWIIAVVIAAPVLLGWLP